MAAAAMMGTTMAIPPVTLQTRLKFGTSKPDNLVGSSDPDSIWGFEGDDKLDGLDGNDILDGGIGADTMAGGRGDDIYYVDNGGDVVVENKGEGTDRVYASISYTLGAHVEHLSLVEGSGAISGTGNGLDNDIWGNSANNVLTGGAGNDRLNGKGGADVMRGGRDDDTYYVDSSGDEVTELADEGLDQVFSSVSHTLRANVENLTLEAGGGAINGTGNGDNNTLTGNDSANTLTGLAGNDILDGRGGADTMAGGRDHDTYYVDNAGDQLSENLFEGDDTVHSSVTYTLRPNFENLYLASGAGAINGSGNDAFNILVGNEAANRLWGYGDRDILDGGGGADTMFGGSGDDDYYVDHILDFEFEEEDDGFDTVLSTIDFTLAPNVEVLILQAEGGDIDGVGNELDNFLVGNASINELRGGEGDDTFYGEGGADIMIGGRDNDIYVVTQSDVKITELAGEGADEVWAFCDYELPDNVEDLYLYSGPGYWGNAAWDEGHNGTGNDLDNYISGTNQRNVLDGRGGNDTLFGDSGADTYVFGFGYGRDTVWGFTGAGEAPGGELIDLRGTGISSFAQVQRLLVDTKEGAMLDLGNGEQLLMLNVAASAFTASDFLLA